MTGNRPTDDPTAAREILAHSGIVLLDFDGPVCSVFDGISARDVAHQLRAFLIADHQSPFELAHLETDDPFEVLNHARSFGIKHSAIVEEKLCSLELEAVATARPTPGTEQLIKEWHDTGLCVAIVSNNSTAAVSAYMETHSLMTFVQGIFARTGANFDNLKPSPYLVETALTALNAPSSQAVLVGDSVADIKAARAAGVRSIGYANKSHKAEQLAAAGAHAVIYDMAQLATLAK
ncbi:HAD hydrolase-like protein [Actinosynnema sp. NPDC049800]